MSALRWDPITQWRGTVSQKNGTIGMTVCLQAKLDISYVRV
jgi:hypothetical protein